jgi:UDP-N-acetylglucosamine 2-epimerase (non-hydrolysing)
MTEREQFVAIIVGTRPEAIKVAPVVLALRDSAVAARVIDTGQQPGRVAEALTPFGLSAHASLGLTRLDGSLNELIALAVAGTDAYLRAERPDAVLVQGDTTTAFAVGLAASMLGIPVGHLEAGLRTGDRLQPFPEETNRVLLADLSALHLVPTPHAARALAREGRAGTRVVVTGNTVVDALQRLLGAARSAPMPSGVTLEPGRQLLAVTVHRRESWGGGIRDVATAVSRLLGDRADLHAVVVTHPNPAVRAEVESVLGSVPRCDLLPPLPYDQMLALLVRSAVVLTDSGGIQEEAPTLRVPVVVARQVTERPEGVAGGWADLVGTDPAAIQRAVTRRLDHPALPPESENPYGDGHAAPRCAQAIAWLLGRAERPVDWTPQEHRPADSPSSSSGRAPR